MYIGMIPQYSTDESNHISAPYVYRDDSYLVRCRYRNPIVLPMYIGMIPSSSVLCFFNLSAPYVYRDDSTVFFYGMEF